MRKQAGFTLIELMVVMAIIAILATAGLAAYGGYIKKARDSTRISDIGAINSVALASLSANGNAPTLDTLKTSLSEMNNGTILEDPLNGSPVCLMSSTPGDTVFCEYNYGQCDNGGYLLRISFESLSNIARYAPGQDELRADSTENTTTAYELGSCDTVTGGTYGVIEN